MVLPIGIKNSTIESAFAYTIIYSVIGVVLSILIPIPINRYLDAKAQKEHEEQHMKENNKEKFLKVKSLKEKYRYKKLGIEEIISDKDINRHDKLILLEAIHGCTPDKACELLGAAAEKEE